jgi:hypothetical protein
MVFRGQDLWRRAPIFRYGFTDVLPGFREGAALFTVYAAAEWMYNKASSKKGGHGHGDDHGAAHGAHGHAEPAAHGTAAAAPAHH